jgi:hypothetical protein
VCPLAVIPILVLEQALNYLSAGLSGVSAGNSVLQKGHTFCLTPPTTGIFFLQFGHSTGLAADGGLKHIIFYLLVNISCLILPISFETSNFIIAKNMPT